MVSDAKILSPYLVQVLPGLQDCLLDPIPDVRATSAKAIGSLFVGMGEEHEELRRLIPWLSATLSIETSPVERSGTFVYILYWYVGMILMCIVVCAI